MKGEGVLEEGLEVQRMNPERRLASLEQAAGLSGPGCAVCRGWGDVQLVGGLDRRPADAWGAAGGRCPRCGRRPRLLRHYAGIDVGEV